MRPRPRFNPLEARLIQLEKKVRILNFFVGVAIVVSGMFAIGTALIVFAKAKGG